MAETAERPSFDAFYACTAARLIRHAYALTGEMAEAQDIAQEAFARAWQRWPSVRECDSPEAWVRRVATNLAASRWRRIRLARAVAGHAAERHSPEVSTDSVALVSGLRTLPERQRTVLVLHYMCDLTIDQIAAELSCPAGSVKSWLSRGRTALAAAVRVVEPDAAEPAASQCVSAEQCVNSEQRVNSAQRVTAAEPDTAADPDAAADPETAAEPDTAEKAASPAEQETPGFFAAPVLFPTAENFGARRLHPVPSRPARIEPETSHA